MEGIRTSVAAQRVGNCTLVPKRCALRGPDGHETVLRPKTYAVLHELLTHRGEVVARAALMAAVWPNVTVADEGLTQCIRELRTALGTAGRDMLRTLPRRGYMLDVETADAAAPEAAPAVGAPARRSRRELAMLAVLLATTIATGVWAFDALRPGPPPRAQAERITDRADRWYGSEPGAAAWRGQRALYARASTIDPGYAPAWVGLAFTNANLVHYRHSEAPDTDLRAAEAAAMRAYALAPDDAGANAALAAVDRLRPDRLEQSLAAYQRATELAPADYAMRAQLGWMMVQLGRAEDGDVLLRAALLAAPTSHPYRPSWYYYLGMIDLLLGRGDHGVGWLQRADAAGGGAYLDAYRFSLTMTAALSQAGREEDAAAQLRALLDQNPGLTLDVVRSRPPWGSRHPVFTEQLERVFDGLAKAGLR